MIFYHGSNVEVKKPDLKKEHTRETSDFGRGFYLTPDKDMAKKWACGKSGDKGVVSSYDVNLDGLKIYRFGATEEWLEFVKINRTGGVFPKEYSEYDLLVGPTADDKLFDTLKEYMDGRYGAAETIMYLDIAGYSYQYVFKNEEALNRSCNYLGSSTYTGHTKELVKIEALKAKKEALVKLENIKKEMAKKKEELFEQLVKDQKSLYLGDDENERS